MSLSKLAIGLWLCVFVTACSGGDSKQQRKGGEMGSEQPGASQDELPDNGLPPPVKGVVATCLTECPAGACGHFPDGCGKLLRCGSCADGEVCGLLEPDRCGAIPTGCSPQAQNTACDGKCGAVSDGCSDVFLCDSGSGGVTCDGGQVCGGFAGAAQPNVCVDRPSCVPQSCASLGVMCGREGDGCGGLLDCTAERGCASGQICGTGAQSGQCVDATSTVCTPLSLQVACANACGTVGDGCAGTLECPCPAGESCGGGGVAGQCGSGSSTCTPFVVADACRGRCGAQADGCGGVYQCDGSNGGDTCDASQGDSCGGGGTPNVCGHPACQPRTREQACPVAGAFASCGPVADGCGGLIDCGGCPGAQICGLMMPSICGEVPSCQPLSASAACAGHCGTVPDGCGGSHNCTAANGGLNCGAGEFCGALAPNECGTPPQTCTPRSCAEQGHSCGLASDGCGNVLNCWPGCDADDASCGGDCGESSRCLAGAYGAQACVQGQPSCSGSLCEQLPTGCGSNAPTQLKGTVRTPGRLVNGKWLNQLPVPNAIVYIPSDPSVALPAIVQGVRANDAASCGRCEDEELVANSATVLAAAVTNFKGEFTLKGRIPVGTAFNLVIKVGKWRRVVQVPAGTAVACATRTLSLESTRLAATSSDGLSGTHLPKIAVTTGDVDAMECVLRGMGIGDAEFSVPSGKGRIHMYRANGARMGSSSRDQSVADTTLYASQTAINAYDMVVFDCEGQGHYIRGASQKSRVLNYVNAGGRVFASHWSYEWLDNNGALDNAAQWNVNGADTSATGYVSLPSGPTQRAGANPVKSLLYRDWLDFQGALTGSVAGRLSSPSTPQLTITDPRDVAGGSVGSTTDEWLYRNNSGGKVQQLSFNTPYGSGEDQICGRVAFSAFHVAANASGTTLATSNLYFPSYCKNAELTPQEKSLAFMLFDLATCVSAGDPPAPPACTPKTAAELCPTENSACGYLSDGCGGVVDCGGCGAGFYCDGNACRPQECTPATCASLGYNCGEHADGCGGVARDEDGAAGCGTCSDGQVCGLGGPGLCGSSHCQPIDMDVACPDNACGLASDGCGGTYDCGGCSSGVCGGGGAGQCGENSCTPIGIAMACAGKNCGLVADGCGGTYDCGQCTAPLSCGGGGKANVCGQPSCSPLSKEQACAGLECGWVSNGCGGAIACGKCANGGVCGGRGPNLCGAVCKPRSCESAGAECGAISDHCGGITECGACPDDQTCGAGGPNRCGTTSCTPTTCDAARAECGLIGNGCGGVLDCGTCTAPETCGGAGVANQCGTGTGGCTPLRCEDQHVQCGAASDGCGGLLDCGGCDAGSYCTRGVCEVVPQ